MTAKNLIIYAKGGGHGHKVRATNLANNLTNEYNQIYILTNSETQDYLPNLASNIKLSNLSWQKALALVKVETDLIVDTFPYGLYNEIIPTREFKLFNKTTLICRYSKDPKHIIGRQYYQNLLAPYAKETSEWEVTRGLKHIGPITRKSNRSFKKNKNIFTVIDSQRKIPSALLQKLNQHCNKLQVKFQYLTAIPNLIETEKLLFIGAGYNTFYETLQTKTMDIRYVPLSKKYDDQYKRVKLYNKGIHSLNELIYWLEN